jgi:hypothetical protein
MWNDLVQASRVLSLETPVCCTSLNVRACSKVQPSSIETQRLALYPARLNFVLVMGSSKLTAGSLRKREAMLQYVLYLRAVERRTMIIRRAR